MLHRLLATSIVAFWLAMTSMLVVRELYPESAGLNSVSVVHVGQLFFQHQQSSDLQVQASGEKIGFIHVQARPQGQSEKRELEIDGNLHIPLPNRTPQRLGWFGRFYFTSRFNLERFVLDISAQTPGQHVVISVDCFAKTAEFEQKMGSQVVRRKTITLDEKGFGALIADLGFNPALLQQFHSANTPLPQFEFKSQVSSIILSGEKISTFLLTMNVAGQPIFEAHVSQLGQILKARMPLLGYKLASFKEVQ